MTMMKRCRETTGSHTGISTSLTMLSSGELVTLTTQSSDRVFECKTCYRRFKSFQALGGHRASHKRPRIMEGDLSSKSKPKAHQCSVCGLEFAMGQALGGHMRAHRGAEINNNDTSSLTLSPPSPPRAVQSFKRSNSSKRVLCLDLNLSPPVSFEFLFENRFSGNRSPMIHCFI